MAVPGVDGEPVTLTEPVTEAIAAAFSAWLSEKKKVDASKPFKVSVGHDSRITARVLQVVLFPIVQKSIGYVEPFAKNF